jgi:two-component system alkaline phosphatase synthesis response regulator PhoP
MTRILVIDDELAITELLEAMLADEGYQVLTASNGQEGLERLAALPVDLIICDIMMPVMDGRDFCRAVQGHEQYQRIPIVLMSAARELVFADDCRFTAFTSKPFDLDDILAIIEQLIGPASGRAAS